MRFAEAVVAILIIGSSLAIGLGYGPLQWFARRRARWTVETHALPSGGWTVQLKCPGEPLVECARVRPEDEYKLFDYEAEAEAVAANRNAALKRQRKRLL
jgi:hypothetical protein